MRDVVLKMMLLKLQRRGIDVERLRQQRTHIAHRLFALTHLYKIQDLRRIRQRILDFPDEVGVAILPNGNVLNVGDPRARRIQTRFHRQRGKSAVMFMPIQDVYKRQPSQRSATVAKRASPVSFDITRNCTICNR